MLRTKIGWDGKRLDISLSHVLRREDGRALPVVSARGNVEVELLLDGLLPVAGMAASTDVATATKYGDTRWSLEQSKTVFVAHIRRPRQHKLCGPLHGAAYVHSVDKDVYTGSSSSTQQR